jgi:nucleoside 2-deoxyribosyltransferase
MPRTVFSLFVSSTSQDLAPCRAKVREMIERMRQTTIAMETFGAKPKKPLQTCREEVQSCDALIVIVGHRYGWIPSREEGGDSRKSITWWEVQWAIEAGKPVYAFLLDPQAPWTAPREQDRLISARTSDEFQEIGRAVALLQELRGFLDSHQTREFFTSPDDLGGKVATSVHDWLLEQAIALVHASLPAASGAALSPAPGAAVEGGTLSDVQQMFWQEQIHLLSARRFAGKVERPRIVLISGLANCNHPALAKASIKQIDA